jgi:hypothetical protein
MNRLGALAVRSELVPTCDFVRVNWPVHLAGRQVLPRQEDAVGGTMPFGRSCLAVWVKE